LLQRKCYTFENRQIYPRELDSQRATDHVLPTIDAAEETTILTAIGASTLSIPGFSQSLRPLMAFIPDTTRSSVLPGNDIIGDSDGADVIVGDIVTGSASLLLDISYSIPFNFAFFFVAYFAFLF
jgi:hypothetical protein